MTACNRAGCDGTIDDGFCLDCGRPPLAAATPASAAAKAATGPNASAPGVPASGVPASVPAQKPSPQGSSAQQVPAPGTPPASAPSASAPPASAPPASAPGGSAPGTPATPAAGGPARCARKGCDGTIDADGYCDDCGRPAAEAAPASASAAGRPSSQRSSQRSSHRSSSNRSTSGRLTSGRSSRRSGRSSARRLGAGLVNIPPVEVRDPASVLMKDPSVPEERRTCRTCDRPVGRSRNGRPAIDNGFCPHDGTPFSFAPKLAAEDLVADQYRIVGCLARGGFGWVYLATDTFVHDRWVVLKGLLGSGDADARAAAVAEQRVLSQIQHPNIVQIHNIGSHPDARTGVHETYIVMEYVGGMSLKDLVEKRRRETGNRREVLPVEQVLAYAIEILPAFGHLHARDLVYCDFKPDNVIQTEDQLKLIDMGAVRDLNDTGGAIYGTVGYQAPEIEELGPSVESDLFTVGRTMAVLSFPFANFTRRWKYDLPPAEEVPLFQEFDSYHRLLQRATDRDPERRFASAAEMAEQCVGVLREVVAHRTGEPRPALSTLFGPETRVVHADATPFPAAPDPSVGAAVAGGLPVPRVDPADPAAGLLATLSTTDPDELAAALDGAGIASVEGMLRIALMCVERGQPGRAEEFIDEVEPDDWRVPWYRGLAALAAGRVADALVCFDDVRGALPGERAPRLALGACLELLGRHDAAAREYAGVWTTDRGYVSAAFGLARCRLALGDRPGAIETLESVPDTSSHYVAAQTAALRIRVRGRSAEENLHEDLLRASDRLEALPLEGETRDRLAVELLGTALDWVRAGARTAAPGTEPAAGPPGTVLGSALRERPLRLALEGCYRSLARHVTDRQERFALVDRANEVRPRTWV